MTVNEIYLALPPSLYLSQLKFVLSIYMYLPFSPSLFPFQARHFYHIFFLQIYFHIAYSFSLTPPPSHLLLSPLYFLSPYSTSHLPPSLSPSSVSLPSLPPLSLSLFCLLSLFPISACLNKHPNQIAVQSSVFSDVSISDFLKILKHLLQEIR